MITYCSKKTWYGKNSISHKNRKRKRPSLGNTEDNVCLVKKPTTAYRALSGLIKLLLFLNVRNKRFLCKSHYHGEGNLSLPF